MLKTHDIIKVEITDTTPLGAGVAKPDGFTVFCTGALTGEVCDVRITEVKKNYAMAECIAIDNFSPRRCDTGCTSYPACGGCTLRHMDYALEGEIKESSVRHALSKCGITPRVFNSIVMPSEEEYRNKVSFRFDKSGNACFYSAESHRAVKLPVDGCKVCPTVFSDIAVHLTRIIAEKKLTPPDEVMLRISRDGEINAAITGKLSEAEIGSYVISLCSHFTEITGVVVRQGARERYRAVMGEKQLITELMGVNFRVSPEAFFQVNYEGAEKLFGEVLRLAEKTKFTRCADLYCGTGTIGMILASRFRDAHFTGVEINAEAVADAKHNAKLNGIKNIDFFCGDAAGYARDEKPELVVVDPPRKGLSDGMVDVLKELGAESMIYVSCNPFTLARDLSRMAELGYTVDEVTPVNMFPRSEHCEVVVRLVKE
ncbi:MAG: 23S rRNA (uracil(1939)-C(5))-methyltransferase RlmD [Clostridia bacterium]|nr:23S rRNA (uracil(1939)-C(5))-methyltransferase RlmD [Clostridia bacterium]